VAEPAETHLLAVLYSMLLAVFIKWLASQIRHSQLAETAVSRFYQMASQPIMPQPAG